MTKPPSTRLAERWLDALLPNVAWDGWTEQSARKAADEAGLTDAQRTLAAPRGVPDLIEAFFDRAERTAAAEMAARDLSELGVRGKVSAGLRAWLDALSPDREAVRRAAAHGLLPWRAGEAAQRLWSIADTVWTAAGDDAEDYNRYTKRGLLAAVIPASLLYWLTQDDQEKVDAFIERRLTNAMRVGRAGGRVLGPVLDRVWPVRREA